MQRKLYLIGSITLLLVLLSASLVAGAGAAGISVPQGLDQSKVVARVTQAVYTPTTTITVNSGEDPDSVTTYTCDYSSGAYQPAPDGKCTLRRALVQAGALDAASRPILVAFDIPATTENGYNATSNVWKIMLSTDLDYIENGEVIIDGNTQTGGRATGPKIIIHGGSLKLGETQYDDSNMVLNIAIQQGSIQLIGDDNVVENCWVGLSDDGMTVDYAPGGPARSNYAYIGGSSDFNVVSNNVVASAWNVSLEFSGDDNVATGNRIGTRADGTLPDVPFNRLCQPNAFYHNWFTGDGIHVYGHRNQIGGPNPADGNLIAGMLFASLNPANTPPDALEVTGDDNVIQNNTIGGEDAWVCGLAVTLDGQRNEFLSNQIINAHGGGFGIYGNSYSLDAITLQSNVVKNAPFALIFGPTVPSAWKVFNPAAITGIAGTTVSGTSGADSPCANCTVELFLDDGDDAVEMLQSLGTTTADGTGAWSFDIGVTLAPTQGLRTASTTAAAGQIDGFAAGTTSKPAPALYPTGVTPPAPVPTPTFGAPEIVPTPTLPETAEPPTAYTTMITVTDAEDPDTSSSYTCYRNLGTWQPEGDGLCTLRRAIIEASHLDTAAYPVLISFNIPMTSTMYNATLGVWKIVLEGDLPYVKHGQVTLDATTQPGGRSDGPKIIVRGGSLKLGEILGEDENIARGFLVQQGSIRATTNFNIIENNWVGLSDDGQTVDYALDTHGEPDPARSNYAYIGASGNNNLIRDNVSASAWNESFSITGDENVVIRNYGGTRADGTVPEVAGNRKCKPNAVFHTWFTGDGINVSGDYNWIGGPNPADGNVFAGMLFASADPENSPPTAMEVYGIYNLLQNNVIGVGSDDKEVGVCGTGIYVMDRYNFILDNTIVNTGLYAIGIYGDALLNAITLQGNTLKDVPEAINFGPLVPDAWKYFQPAVISTTAGTTVNGGAGDPCPSCSVEVFLDDGDDNVEALSSLGIVTATATGDWSLDIGFTLAPTQGLRTASTTRHYGVMAYLDAGTTSDFSGLWPDTVTPPPTSTIPPTVPPTFPEPEWLPVPTPPALPYAHIITVTSASDLDTSKYVSCYEGPGVTTPSAPCTLRRAIVEVSGYRYEPGTHYPILIKFDIPDTDPGYNAGLDVWKIILQGDLLPVEGGQVVIDGSTQPGGRSDGPKIIIRGGTIYLGEFAGDDNNVARGLAIQQGAIRAVGGTQNIIENNWVGLSDDGLNPDYTLDLIGNPDPSRANFAYIRASDHNLIQNNVVANVNGVNLVIDGDDNLVINNCAGTRADCTVPIITSNRKCRPDAFYNNWFTGIGVTISGHRNRVMTNTIAGMLFASMSSSNSPPGAIDVYGQSNLIQGNQIGVDNAGNEIGVCGPGIYIGDRFNQIFDNLVVNTGSYALGIYGTDLINAVTWQGNTFREVPAAVEFGPLIPEAWKTFAPAQVTGMAGTTVNGTNGTDSACAYCTVELFLDDGDEFVEATPVGKTMADEDGNWSVDIGMSLPPTQGLRTASTTADYGQIANFEVGATSDFGTLYHPSGSVTPPDPEPDPTPLPPETPPTITYLPEPTPPPTYATHITVTTTWDDPEGSNTDTCYRNISVYRMTGDGLCTLRRALVEAGALSRLQAGSTPVKITFNIPLTDTGYISTTDVPGVWKIVMVSDLPVLDASDVTIDGTTQPGGRSDGPKLIIRNANLVLGQSSGNEGNIARGLAVQQGSLRIVGNRSILENNWVGLSDDGQTIDYALDLIGLPDPSRSNYAYIGINGENNLARGNVAGSAIGENFYITGNDHLIVENCAGTRADCTVPVIAENRRCHPDARFHNWFTGDGMNISGHRTRVFSNTIAGMLFASASPDNTPPVAIEVYGTYNLFRWNRIGMDAADHEVGVCGGGVYIVDAFNQFIENTIVNTGWSAFSIFGSEVSLDAITLRGNIIRDVPQALEFGPTVPEPWRFFNAASISETVGTTVHGTSGADSAGYSSACPYCQVEVFLDDGDEQVETLQSLGLTYADATGDWSLDIGVTLAPTQGLRTASTTRNFDIIGGFEMSTTSNFSDLWPTNVTPPPAEPDPAPVAPEVAPAVTYLPAPTGPLTYATYLTVTTTEDPDTSSSYTCVGTYSGGYRPASDGLCTLRRAIVEAGVYAVPRPVYIAFDIPTSDDGYNNTLQVWKIELSGDLAVVKNGYVVIDGNTQPGGRTTGPKIIVRNGNIKLGQGVSEDGCVVRGLAMQQGSIHAVGDSNIVEDNWAGLSDDGMTIDYYNDDPTRSNYASIAAAGDNNLIQNNVSASAQGVSFDITGDDNLVRWNYAGTRADGTLPAVSVTCTTGIADGWWTGIGMNVWGSRNQVLSNTLAGMMYASSGGSPPWAMDIQGAYNLVQGNAIGVDATGADAWVCGRAVYLDGMFNQLLANKMVNAPWGGIGIYGSDVSLDGLTMRGNIIRDTYTALEFGPTVPIEWRFFNPALVTTINGMNVNGISDDDCPYCTIDLYLDDEDETTEALQYLGSTAANAQGDWAFTLPAALNTGEGLRTVSTARAFGVIPNFEIGTSSRFSTLFQERPPQAPTGVSIITDTEDLQAGKLWVGQEINFLAQVQPLEATLPVTYTWEATGLESQTVRGGVEKAVKFTWTTPGTKEVHVTAFNTEGSVQTSITVEIYQAIKLVEVVLDGAKTGYTGFTHTFTATATPVSTTLPITYTWEATDQMPVSVATGKTMDTIDLTWTLTGTKTITVTATNLWGSVSDAHTIEIEESPCFPVTDVDLTVLTASPIYTYTLVQFSADIMPDYATKPYTVTIDYGSGPLTATTSSADPLLFDHTFTTAGVHTVEVAVWNCALETPVVADVIVTVTAQTGPMPVAPATVAVNGAPAGMVNVPYTFTIATGPSDVTTPLNYTVTWTEGTTPATFSGDRVTAYTHVTWSTTGVKYITVTATNAGGSATGYTSIMINTEGNYHIYLPLVVRQ
ncbi:MAG: PKD domain-containing protein [Anaerolineae bacterium]|nr:PKD domain-containing protein [Anaerolineae bacterium]